MSEALVFVYIYLTLTLSIVSIFRKINVRESNFKDYINLDKIQYFGGNTQQLIVGLSKYFIQYDPLM